MYQLFEHFWFQRAPVTLVEAFTRVRGAAAAAAARASCAQLPERYVAAKFYGNVALPRHAGEPRVRRRLSWPTWPQHIDVVLLNTGQRFDDHDDFPPELARPPAHDRAPDDAGEQPGGADRGDPRTPQAFVGTYGGFSYLAPLLRRRTRWRSTRTRAGFRFDHLEVAKRVFSALRCGTFAELDLRATDVAPARVRRRLPRSVGVGR